MFDPYDLFILGARMLRIWSDEATCRTVIGRAYYSCFLIVRDQMFGTDRRTLSNARKKRIIGHDGGEHEAVGVALLIHPKLTAGHRKVLGDQLRQLRDIRVQADYFRDSTSKSTTDAFAKFGANDWNGLAQHTMTLASSLLPSLLKVPTFP